MSENEGGRLNFALGFQEVLNTTFSLLFKNMFKFFIIIFIVGIPSLLISNFLPGLFLSPMEVQKYINRPFHGDLNSNIVIIKVIISLIDFLLYTLGGGALSISIVFTYLEKKVNIGDCFNQAFQKIISLIGAAIIFFLGVFLTFIIIIFATAILGQFHPVFSILFAIPAFIYAVVRIARYILYVPIIMVEGRKAFDALKRSKDLVDGYVKKTIGTFALMGIIYLVISEIFGQALQISELLGRSQMLFIIIHFILNTIFVIIFYILYTVLFFDFKARKESFGLELLAEVFD